jgi:hypothetical protein
LGSTDNEDNNDDSDEDRNCRKQSQYWRWSAF